MTEIAQIYLGNIDRDPELVTLAEKSCLEIILKESDRQKGRIHAHTVSGVAVGIIKSRDRTLQSGDLFKTDSDKLLLIQIQEQELLVLDLSQLDRDIAQAKLVLLGHTLGNHHYPITIQQNIVYVQLITDKLVLEKLISDLDISGLQIKYQSQSKIANFSCSSHSH